MIKRTETYGRWGGGEGLGWRVVEFVRLILVVVVVVGKKIVTSTRPYGGSRSL